MSSIKNFFNTVKTVSKVLTIEGRDAMSEGVHILADKVDSLADKIEPTEEQRTWAIKQREEWDKKVEDNRVKQYAPSTAR